jgi:hypothetical protein
MKNLRQPVAISQAGVLLLAAMIAWGSPSSASPPPPAAGRSLDCNLCSIKCAFKHYQNTAVLFGGKVRRSRRAKSLTTNG